MPSTSPPQPANPLSSLEWLSRRCFEFVTFLYAAAVHLTIHHVTGDHGGGPMLALGGAAVLFLFSDWLSRVRLPELLPEKSRLQALTTQLSRTALEVIGLFFLASAAVLMFKHASAPNQFNAQDSIALFAAFLVTTFVWNLLMLRVMQQVSWLDLTRSGLAGSIFNLRSVEIYLHTFHILYQRLVHRRETLRRTTKREDSAVVAEVECVVRIAMLRTSVQYVAFHLALANILGAILLIVSASGFLRLPWVKVSIGFEGFLGWIAFGVLGIAALIAIPHRFLWHLVVVLTALFISLVCFPKAQEFVAIPLCWAALLALLPTLLFGLSLSRLAGVVSFLLPSLMYFTLNAHQLIAALCLQQVLASLFLQFAADGKKPSLEVETSDQRAPAQESTATALPPS